VDEMAGWILELSEDELLRKEMGMKARERIELDFTFERGLEEIITLLSGPTNSSLSPNR
jgi:glycosyltransferase involved in cell wall biosynthesis